MNIHIIQMKSRNVYLYGLLFFLLLPFMSHARVNGTFKKIGDIRWKPVIKGSRLVSVSETIPYTKTSAEEVLTHIPWKQRKLYQKETKLVSTIVSTHFKEPERKKLHALKKHIKPSQKIAAPPFLYKDNSLFDISYLDKSHGFLSDAITAVVEDKNHIIWIATEDIGLVKFDGNYFYVYDQQSGLPSNSINHLLFHSSLGLMIASDMGFYWLSKDSLNIPHVDGEKNETIDAFRLSVDEKKNVWICTRNRGAYKIMLNQKSIQNYGKHCGLPSNLINDALQDGKNRYWFASLGLIQIKNSTITHLHTENIKYNHDQALKIAAQKDTLWVGTFDNGLIKITPQKAYQYSIYEHFGGRIFDFSIGKNTLFMAIYGGGIASVYKGGCRVYDGNNGLDFQAIQLCADSYENIWVACPQGGIFRINNAQLEYDTSMPGEIRNAITIKDDLHNNRWFFLNGLGMVKETAQGYCRVTNKAKNPYPSVFHFFDGEFTSDGSLWLGAYSYGIAQYKNKQFTFYKYSDNPIDQIILDTEIDREGRVWFATMKSGLLSFKGNILHRLSAKNGLTDDRITFLSKTPKGSLMVFSGGGIQQISNDTIYNLFLNDTLLKINPVSVCRGKEGKMLVSTDAGLLLIDNYSVYALDKTNKIHVKKISHIMEAEPNVYWMLSSDGILKVQLHEETLSEILVIGQSDAFLRSRINGNGFADRNGQPHWSSAKGFLTCKFDTKITKKDSPHIALSGISINGIPFTGSHYIEIKPQESLELDYHMNLWGDEHALQQKYLLINLSRNDTAIHSIGEKGVIRLQNLIPDKYGLQLMAEINGEKYFSKQMRFTVLPHWYKTTWFLCLCILFIAMLVFVYFKYRTKRLITSQILLEETIKNRTLELKSSLAERDLLLKEIHHRVKNNLQVISGLLELQKEEEANGQIKEALSESQNRVMSVALIHHNLYRQEHLSNLSFHSLVPELAKSISEVFSSTHINLEIVIDGDDVVLDLDTIVPLGLLVNELITNAYKYAVMPAKKARVKFQIAEPTSGHYTLTYMDNGPGIPDEFNFDTATSLGLRLIKDLIEQLGGNAQYRFHEGAQFHFHFKSSDARRED